MNTPTPEPDVEALLQQGDAELDRGQYQPALKIFQQASALEPQNQRVIYSLGLACYRLERYPVAIDYFNEALKIQPSYI